jgi:hypothetical protein
MNGIISRNRLPALLLLPSLLFPLSLTAPALAQDVAPAEVLFTRGMAHMDAGRYEAGCKLIAESQRLDPRPGTLFTLAVCEMQWGRIATAAAHYADYLSLYDHLTPEQKARQKTRPKEAKAQRDALLPLVPELTVVLPPGAPTGTVVKRNGAVVADAALGIGLPVDPGEHVVTTQAPGGPVGEQRITLGKGEKKQLTLEVKLTPEASTQPAKTEPVKAQPVKVEPQPPKAPEGSDGRRIAMYVVGGVGVAGLVLGGVMGGLTLGKKGTIADHCGSKVGSKDATACDPTGLDAASSGKTLALVSTIGFGVGLAGIGTAAVLLLTEPKRAKPADTASRRWITAGVLEAGPAGAMVGARGRW